MGRVISADGTAIAWYETGSPDAPTVVAVHGYPNDHTLWDGVAADLADDHRVITYDVRGAGASATPKRTDAYRMERLVEDLIAVLDAAAPDRAVHLLGHDWGSVQGWAAIGDERLRDRILSYTSISGPSIPQLGQYLRQAHKHPRGSLRQAARSYYTLLFQLPKLPEAAIAAGVLDRAAGPGSSHDDQRAGLALYRANLGATLARRAPRIDIPVQVLAPRGDSYVTAEAALGAPVEHVRDLRTRVITGKHWVVRDRPTVVAACVREFVAHVDGAPETRGLAQARQRGGAFAGQLVLITGGARGIGRATALEFARAGADVIVADVDDLAAKQTAHDVAVLGVAAHDYHLDVSDAAAWDEFASTVQREHGTPDVVVNNAGIGMSGPLLDTDVADWDRVLGVNLWGVIHGSRIFGRQLVERGRGGHIVNLASAAAFTPSRTLPAYATTKAAVLMLTECLRAELAGEGIGVTAICPGFVDSDITRTTRFVGRDSETESAMRDKASTAYHRRNYPPERVARQIVKATASNVAVQPVTIESRLFRAIGRFAPPLARQLAKIDLTAL